MRRTDARLMLRRAAICRLLTPSAKSVSISPACLRTVGGRPWSRPSLRAWAIPAFTRSRRISRSNFAFCGELQNAEFERGLIIERTREGMKAARERGVRPGPPPKLSPKQIAHALKLLEKGDRRDDIADILNVSRTTLYRALV